MQFISTVFAILEHLLQKNIFLNGKQGEQHRIHEAPKDQIYFKVHFI